MNPARDVAEWLTWAEQIPRLPRDLTTINDDGPEPDPPREDHLLDRHRANVDERYSDRAWGEVA